MSKVGKLPVAIPAGVTVTVADNCIIKFGVNPPNCIPASFYSHAEYATAKISTHKPIRYQCHTSDIHQQLHLIHWQQTSEYQY